MNTPDLTRQPHNDPTAFYRHCDVLYAVDLLTAALRCRCALALGSNSA